MAMSCRDLAAQFLALAEKQRASFPLMLGHRLLGASLLLAGDIAEGRAHLDQAIALYDPAEHRPLAMRFGEDTGWQTYTFDQRLFGCLAIPKPRSRTSIKRSRMRARAATQLTVMGTRWLILYRRQLLRKLRDSKCASR